MNAVETDTIHNHTGQQTVRTTLGYECILVEYDGPITTVTMNCPACRNTLSLTMMEELVAALKAIGSDPSVRVVILAANGPVYCSGHDLRELADGDIRRFRRLFDVATELMLTIESIPQPVIAKVHRLATAAGCQLVAACDLVVPSEEATFSVPGMKIGLCCTTPMVPLTRAIGRKRALEMLLTAEVVSVQTAADWGLVNRVVPDNQLDAAARGLAVTICNASPLTVALGKQTFYVQAALDDQKAYAYAKELMTMNAMASDAHEGVNAFLEKRQPIWTRH